MPDEPITQAQAAEPQLVQLDHTVIDGHSDIPADTVHSNRTRRQPRHYNDIFPDPHVPALPSWISRIKKVTLRLPEQLPERVVTPANSFGLFRSYLVNPTYSPDLPNVTAMPGNCAPSLTENSTHLNFAVFANFSQYAFASLWIGNRTGKLSDTFFNDLIKLITNPDFFPEDLHGWSASKMKRQLETSSQDSPEEIFDSDEWIRNVKVSIRIPEGRKYWKSPEGTPFDVSGFHHRSIIKIIKNVYQTATHIHFTPFESYVKSPHAGEEQQRVYGELYTSPIYIREQMKLERMPQINHERVIAPLMFWSDSTRLANFGSASLWPIYMFFGSQSKTLRGKPSLKLCHHIAYIPTLPDSIQDVVHQATGGTTGRARLLAHCKRELIHAIWNILLDDEFCQAYYKGILTKCADGIERLVYPRIFTYSADYPEKVLLTTIRDKGLCGCPRCLIKKDQFHEMGMDHDTARRQSTQRRDNAQRQNSVKKARSLIYVNGVPINSERVENILKPKSLVPTQNAFSVRLKDFGFEFHSVFTVDFLHEIELGVWKTLLTHVIRLLYAQAPTTLDAVRELNKRYRNIPSFGGDTIRKFKNDVSEMKQLAARDYEDILQCSIPAFEGLLDESVDTELMGLLYVLAYWHGVAKLRMHTDSTIQLLLVLTKQFGIRIRHFKQISSQRYKTTELPKEKAARLRRETTNINGRSRAKSSPKERQLNLNTYKFHAMGDYTYFIQNYGSIESYSTERGEREHRIAKQRFSRVWKKDTTLSLTRLEHRDRNMHSIEARMRDSSSRILQHDELEEVEAMDPRDHWSISSSQRNRIYIPKFTKTIENDPATHRFHLNLQDHLLARILGKNSDDDEISFTPEERQRIIIVDDVMFEHARLRVNYTSYDLRRCQDTLNPKGNYRDFMVHAADDATSPYFHPYWYGRILGIFHVNVVYLDEHYIIGPAGVKKMHFLWVRWFGRDTSYASGPKNLRLDRIGFVHEEDDTDSFGFVDPNHIIRATHLIPVFSEGKTTELLQGDSIARRYDGDEKEDWQFYYVNCFADRDMLMRYMGGGIGHSLRNKTDILPTPTPGDQMAASAAAGSENDTEVGIQGLTEDVFEEGVEDPDAKQQPELHTLRPPTGTDSNLDSDLESNLNSQSDRDSDSDSHPESEASGDIDSDIGEVEEDGYDSA